MCSHTVRARAKGLKTWPWMQAEYPTRGTRRTKLAQVVRVLTFPFSLLKVVSDHVKYSLIILDWLAWKQKFLPIP